MKIKNKRVQEINSLNKNIFKEEFRKDARLLQNQKGITEKHKNFFLNIDYPFIFFFLNQSMSK